MRPLQFLVPCLLLPECNSFVTETSGYRLRKSRRTSLSAGWLDDLQGFFDNLWSPPPSATPNSTAVQSHQEDQHTASSILLPAINDDDNMPAGTTRIVHIPVETIKPGGLRLFLMFYLLGKQKSADGVRLWTAHQPTSASDEYVIEFFFHDRSAMLTVELSQDGGVTIDRVGSLPSTAYVIHESSIIEGILDELHLMAFDESVSLENRLLILPEPQNAIDKARETVAFG